jgi:hypothetical protein
MLVEPLADVDVNVPGVMAMLVAPDVAQLSVLLAPELMPVGFAVKEAIAGLEPFPVDDPDGIDAPLQFSSPAQASEIAIETSAQKTDRAFRQNEFLECMSLLGHRTRQTITTLHSLLYGAGQGSCSCRWSLSLGPPPPVHKIGLLVEFDVAPGSWGVPKSDAVKFGAR